MEDKIWLQQLQREYAQFKFRPGKKFAFRPPVTIIYATDEQDFWRLQLLHELGHARCEHKFFATDPERLKMEREAWEEAKNLCKKYQVEYDEQVVEGMLDSYRDWLHQRSKCPDCGLTRYQTRDGKYHCPRCTNML